MIEVTTYRSITPIPREGTETQHAIAAYFDLQGESITPFPREGTETSRVITDNSCHDLEIDNPISPRGDGNTPSVSKTINLRESITPFPREGTETLATASNHPVVKLIDNLISPRGVEDVKASASSSNRGIGEQLRRRYLFELYSCIGVRSGGIFRSARAARSASQVTRVSPTTSSPQ